jgi:hypothetical protein
MAAARATPPGRRAAERLLAQPRPILAGAPFPLMVRALAETASFADVFHDGFTASSACPAMLYHHIRAEDIIPAQPTTMPAAATFLEKFLPANISRSLWLTSPAAGHFRQRKARAGDLRPTCQIVVVLETVPASHGAAGLPSSPAQLLSPNGTTVLSLQAERRIRRAFLRGPSVFNRPGSALGRAVRAAGA